MARIIPRLSAAERKDFVKAARRYLGVRFQHRGRSMRGLDCLGLVVLSMREIGYEMEDREVYGRDPSNDGMQAAAIAHFGKPIKVSKIAPGDLVLMQWHGSHLVNHVAIVTDYPPHEESLALIHAFAQNGCVIEHRLGDPWPRRITEAFRP